MADAASPPVIEQEYARPRQAVPAPRRGIFNSAQTQEALNHAERQAQVLNRESASKAVMTTKPEDADPRYMNFLKYAEKRGIVSGGDPLTAMPRMQTPYKDPESRAMPVFRDEDDLASFMDRARREAQPLSISTGKAQLQAMARRLAEEEGIPAQHIETFIRQIGKESSWDPNAVSNKGAQGLGQLMPPTAKELGVEDPFNPEQNLRGAARYMVQQLRRFNGDIAKALAAYNAGAGNVRKYGGIPPFRETQRYVRDILEQD